MATSRHEGIHPFESQFPIVATNLRALVSSWLPPAREPSPVDDETTVDGETEGRPERLALGATLSVSQPSTQFQNRMNRKMGIPGINGTAKTDVKKFVNGKASGMVNGNGKRIAETEDDSEEDSRSRLIKKKPSKENPQLGEAEKRKKNPVKHSAINPALSLANSSSFPAGTDPEISKKRDAPLSEDPSISSTASAVVESAMETPKFLSAASEVPSKGAIRTAEERERLKKEKKKERKRQRRLEKQEKSKESTS